MNTHSRTFRAIALLAATAALAISPCASASEITIDFSTEDDFITPLANGQHVASPGEFGTLFTLSASGNNQGAAIFGSNPAGPNLGTGDDDLLVGLGNVLILQDNAHDDQSTPGFFDHVDDANEGGTISFDFLVPVVFTSITLIDIDNNADVMITLTDGSGLQRMYDIDSNFTFDIAEEGTGGFETLDLATMSVQVGEGGGSATPSQDAGFDQGDVWSLSVELQGSGALDNLTFAFPQIPSPPAFALLGVVCGCSGRRRNNA